MFGRSIKIATIFGISIEIDFSWFVIFFLVAWSLSKGYFPYKYPEIGKQYYWTMGIIASLLLFLSVLLHELSHSYIALRNNLPISKITLFIFGGVANLAEEVKTPGVEFRVAIAGPICSFVLMFLCHFLAGLAEPDSGVFAVLSYVSLINGILAIFNLIPGFPLDGGRLLRSAMWYFTGNYKGSTYLASTIGKGFAFFLMAMGFFQIMSGNTFNGIWLIFIGYFLKGAAESSYQQVVMKEIFTDLTAEKVMKRHVISVTGGISIRNLVDDYFLNYHYDSFPVVAGTRTIGIINMPIIKHIPKEEWDTTTVQAVMTQETEKYLVSPGDSVDDLLSRMVRGDLGWLLVVKDDQSVAGIVTRSDIMHLLKIKSDLNE